mmetsp:Transcript_51496/g.130861  ORF Transcript_51496/g.130861 Transcript_51496/m.130861 type:complete len:317 (+) Transcript_51496:71-1021(+)
MAPVAPSLLKAAGRRAARRPRKLLLVAAAAAGAVATLGAFSAAFASGSFARGTEASSSSAASRLAGRAAAGRRAASKLPRRAFANEDEWMEVWNQTATELSLDMRELLTTDANVFFVGPDMDTYADAILSIADRLNYTHFIFDMKDAMAATEENTFLERMYVVPPLTNVQRWSWAVMVSGLTVWIDPDGYRALDVYERDRVYKLKFPKKKSAFGPGKPPEKMILGGDRMPAADPIDMWMGADVHVDLKAHPDLPVEQVIMGSIIEAMLENPPKWRAWFKQAKMRGTIGQDYQTPFEVRRAHYSNGFSPRLNRLLNA